MKRQLLTFIVLAQLGGTLGACTNIDVKTGCFSDADCFAGSVCIEGACVAPDDFECGNGRVEPGETCDGDCPVSCNDGSSCTTDVLTGSPDDCNVVCTSSDITECVDGDGCCGDSCGFLNDTDCPNLCGNGRRDPSETCDGDCPTSCDDGLRCTTNLVTGSSETCNVECVYEPLRACLNGDDCCPVGCLEANDDDCEDCRDVDTCEPNDGCCPSGCNANTDNDCAPVCGNEIEEPGEECDLGDGNSDTGSCTDSCTDARCGDGLVQTGLEECDGGQTDTASCNYDSGTGPVACTSAACGDEYLNSAAGEECDEGTTDTASCNYDSGTGPAACTAPACGDAYRNDEAGELCDAGSEDSVSCDYANGSSAQSCTPAMCGDGYRNSARGEECDAGQDNSNTEPDACREDCERAHCGDGVIDSDEACDGNDVASGTCSSGFCELECDGGYADCNGDPADGCECDATSWNTLIGFDGNKDVAVDSRGIVYTVDDFPSFGPVVRAYKPKVDWDELPESRWTASFPDAVDVKLAVNPDDILIVAVEYDEGSWPFGRLIGYETALSGPAPTVLFDIDVAEETWPEGGMADVGATATSIFLIGDGTWFNGPDTEVSRYAWAGSGDPVLSSSWKASGGELWFVTATVGADSIAIAGRFRGTTTFGVGQPNETTLVGGTRSIFVAKLSHSLQLQWVRQDEGNINTAGMAIAPDGSIALTGTFLQGATFGEGEANERVIDSTCSSCEFVFLAKYTPGAQLDWVKVGGWSVETTRSSSGEGWGRAVTAVSDGSFVVVGWARDLVLEPGVFVDGELFAAHYSEDGTVLSVSDPMWDEPPFPLYSRVRIAQALDGTILAAVQEITVLVQFTVPGLTP